jgi:flagellar FliL protein
MAEAADEDIQVEEAPQKGGLGKWIIMAAMIVAAAAAGMFGYPLVNDLLNPPEDGGEAAEEEAQPPSKPALFASLHPPLVINFKDEYGDSHFMQMTLEVMARDQAIIDHVRNHSAVIRNNLILLFSNVDYASVDTREGKQKMLDDALAEIQAVVEAETGETGVEAVYFTGLVVQ